MINAISDIIFEEVEIINMRDLLNEIESAPDNFIKLFSDKLKREINEREKELFAEGLCPQCGGKEVTVFYDSEIYDIGGNKQRFNVPVGARCEECGWDSDHW